MPKPFPDYESIEKVLKLRSTIDPLTGKPYSYQAIANRLKNHKKTIIRWAQYGSKKNGGKLSTGGNLTGGK